MSSKNPFVRAPGAGMALAGLLLSVGGLLHPRAETAGEFESTLATMYAAAAWEASHIVTLVGWVVLAVSFAALRRSGAVASDRRLRVLAGIVTVGAGLAAAEILPHLLAASEAEEVVAGDGAPFTSAHLIAQAISTPVLGFGVAAFAVVGARTRAVGQPALAALAVLGGVAVGIVGPAILAFRDPSLAPLFIGSVGIAVWLIVSGIGLARRSPTRRPAPTPAAS